MFLVWKRKSEHHHWILHIQISLNIMFQLKLTIFIFWTKFVQKGCFLLKNRKSEHQHWFLHIWISLDTKFQLKLTILDFSTKFTQKGCFLSKTEKVSITIQFCIFELVLEPNFSLNWQYWFFGPNLQKRVFPVKNRKNKHHRWILHIRISLDANFQFKLTTLIFWTKLSQKGWMNKMNITIEFCILQLVLVPNFSLNWQFWYSGPNWPKKGIPGLKLVRVSMIITYYIKLFHVGADRHNSLLMYLLLLLVETINAIICYAKYSLVCNTLRDLICDTSLQCYNIFFAK